MCVEYLYLCRACGNEGQREFYPCGLRTDEFRGIVHHRVDAYDLDLRTQCKVEDCLATPRRSLDDVELGRRIDTLSSKSFGPAPTIWNSVVTIGNENWLPTKSIPPENRPIMDAWNSKLPNLVAAARHPIAPTRKFSENTPANLFRTHTAMEEQLRQQGQIDPEIYSRVIDGHEGPMTHGQFFEFVRDQPKIHAVFPWNNGPARPYPWGQSGLTTTAPGGPSAAHNANLPRPRVSQTGPPPGLEQIQHDRIAAGRNLAALDSVLDGSGGGGQHNQGRRDNEVGTGKARASGGLDVISEENENVDIYAASNVQRDSDVGLPSPEAEKGAASPVASEKRNIVIPAEFDRAEEGLAVSPPPTLAELVAESEELPDELNPDFERPIIQVERSNSSSGDKITDGGVQTLLSMRGRSLRPGETSDDHLRVEITGEASIPPGGIDSEASELKNDENQYNEDESLIGRVPEPQEFPKSELIFAMLGLEVSSEAEQRPTTSGELLFNLEQQTLNIERGSGQLLPYRPFDAYQGRPFDEFAQERLDYQRLAERHGPSSIYLQRTFAGSYQQGINADTAQAMQPYFFPLTFTPNQPQGGFIYPAMPAYSDPEVLQSLYGGTSSSPYTNSSETATPQSQALIPYQSSPAHSQSERSEPRTPFSGTTHRGHSRGGSYHRRTWSQHHITDRPVPSAPRTSSLQNWKPPKRAPLYIPPFRHNANGNK